MTSFSHGGDIHTFAKAHGFDPSEVLDLSSNINFISPQVKVDFDIRSYPNYDALYQTLARHFKIQTEQVEIYNGGSSAIFSFFRETSSDTCIIYAPAYLEYKKAALLYEKRLIMIDRFNDIYAPIPENSLVIFVNPSTPDGKYHDMEKLMVMWMEKHCTILIDESFLAFTDKPSLTYMLKAYEKLYILTSLTKFYACAGVRMGIMISNSKNIQKLKVKEPLWKLSAYDSAYIQAVLNDTSFAQKAKIENQKAKTFLKEILKDFEVYESDANFFLIRLEDMTAYELQEQLIPHAIMIRDCSNFDFLDERFVRVAVKGIAGLNRFQKSLKKD